jgi:hypothetical protein
LEGNFTGIHLSPSEPAYLAAAGKPEYIYLSGAADTPTATTPAPVAGPGMLKLRSDVGMNEPVVASVPAGTTLQVSEGPVQAGEYVWWKLTGQPGTGWAATQVELGTTFEVPKNCPVDVTADFLWFDGSTKAHGTFYVATRDNVLMKEASTHSTKIKDLPVGTEDTVIGGPASAEGRIWWNLSVGSDSGWSTVDRWGFKYPKE